MKNQQQLSRLERLRLKKRRTRIKRAVASFAVLGVIGGTGAFAINNVTSKVQVADAAQYIEPAERPVKKAATTTKHYDTPTDTFNGPLNILLVGSDNRGVTDGSDVEGMRSDTTILAHISEDRKRVDLVSIPRDSWVDIPGCTLPDGTETYPTAAKFNAAFSYGGQTGDTGAAASCAIKTFENLTDIYVDGFAVIDFKGFEKVVDDLGGVEFTVDEKIEDPSFGNLVIEAGKQTFDGKTALKYARVRHALNQDGSDLSRIGRQQELMSAIAEKAKNKMTDLPAMYNLVGSVAEMTTLSPGLGDMTKTAGLAWTLKDVKKDDINFITVPTVDAGDGTNVLWSDESWYLWESIKADEPVEEFEKEMTQPDSTEEEPEPLPAGVY